MLRPVFVLTISACFLGCGGNVVVDHGGTGGHGGAGGHGAGGGATEGPGPTVGSIASSGTAVGVAAIASSGSGTTCPDKVYEDGSCQVEGQSCPMDQSCCSGGAICKGGQWHFLGATCGQPCLPCGPDDAFACQGGALCVVEQLDVGTTYHCAANPCPPDNESCDCASSLCDGLTCEGVKNQTMLFCDCPNC